MKKIPYKVRTCVGVGLILWSVVAVIATIVWGAYGAPPWALILMSIVSIITLVIGVIFVPRTNADGTPIVIEKKPKVKRPKIRKTKRYKKPFMTNEEWREQEEEDDETMFIEEVVEDD